jgi:hypothetical protein
MLCQHEADDHKEYTTFVIIYILWHDAWKLEQSIAKQHFGKHILKVT